MRGMGRRAVCGRSFSAGTTGRARREQRRRHCDARRIHRTASLLLQAGRRNALRAKRRASSVASRASPDDDRDRRPVCCVQHCE